MVRKLCRRVALVTPWVLAASLASCAPSSPRPDVVFISLDTLRRDHVGAYRPPGDSFTPNLDDFARTAVVLDDAYATIPSTQPSHLSIFTSLHPDVHRVEGKKLRLSDRVPTMPEILKADGYQTLGLVSIDWMEGTFGFARGFDHYERMTHDLTYADRLNRRLFELLDDQPRKQPLLLFLHYIDAHSDFYSVAANKLPFYAQAPQLTKLGIDPDSDEFCTPKDECATDFLLAVNRGDVVLSPAAEARIRALYRAGVEYLDRDLGELFAGLKERGLWDDALIVLTADHGEELGDHGQWIHNQPYSEDIAVPLMVRLPRGAHGGSRQKGLADSTDLLPTILDYLGLERRAHFQGNSLRPLLEQGSAIRPRSLARDKLTPTRYALRTAEYCLVHDLRTAESQLYDLRVDPRELVDVSSSHPQEVAALIATLSSALARNRDAAREFTPLPIDPGEGLTEEEEKGLRALGYLD